MRCGQQVLHHNRCSRGRSLVAGDGECSLMRAANDSDDDGRERLRPRWRPTATAATVLLTLLWRERLAWREASPMHGKRPYWCGLVANNAPLSSPCSECSLPAVALFGSAGPAANYCPWCIPSANVVA